MIPNIVHFNYGLAEQKEEFLFVYYIAVLSCFIINKPKKIYFHYHYEPYGPWWEKTKELVELVKVKIPTHIGSKKILHVAHRSDILRLEILVKYGGIYLDIDTICVRSYKDLLYNKFVMSEEYTNENEFYGLCNAIMMSEQNSEFGKCWLEKYEEHFESTNWQSASTHLPCIIAKTYNKDITILKRDVFLYPSWDRIDLIFLKPYDIPEDLISLHFWNQKSIKILKQINNFDWILNNSYTLYGKLLLNILNKMNDYTKYIIFEETMKSLSYEYLVKNNDMQEYKKNNNINDNINNNHYLFYRYNNIIFSSLYLQEHIFGLPVSKCFLTDFDYSTEGAKYLNITSSDKEFDCDFFVEKNYYNIKLNTKKNNWFKITQKNKELTIFNTHTIKDIYILPQKLEYTPIKNINIIPHIDLKDCKFSIKTNYITKNKIHIIIRRIDNEKGWYKNLYLDVTIDEASYYYYVGKSFENKLDIMITIDEITLDKHNLSNETQTVPANTIPLNLIKGINSPRLIPKKVYYTFKNDNLTTDILNIIEHNKKICPDYEFIFYDNNKCDLFIKDNFSNDIYTAYNKINPNLGAMKADFWRYCILYLYGGVYIDIKVKLYQNLDNIIDDTTSCILDIGKFWEIWRHKPVYEQWMLIFKPNHIYLKKMIDTMTKNILNNFEPKIDEKSQTSPIKQQILKLTGPDALAEIINNSTEKDHIHVDYNLFSHREIEIGKSLYNYNNIIKYEFVKESLFV
jgi:mannosyltransferase OCH1-like enzyme